MDFDDILPDLGEYGRYQRLVLWLLLMPGALPCGFHAYNQIFMALTPDHWCRVPDLENATSAASVNLTEELYMKLSIPYDNASQEYSSCQRYDYDYSAYVGSIFGEGGINVTISPPLNAKTMPCDNGWHYRLEEGSSSVVADWNLVCDNSFQPTFALILFGVSGLVGNLIFGYVQDGLGRRPAFFIYLLILCSFGFATAFAPSFYWWLVFRVGVGFAIPAILSTPLVLAIEIVGPSQRTYMSIMMNVAYSFSLIIIPVIASVVRIWPYLALATILPFTVYFLFWWVLPESPRWLLANGRFDEAVVIMRRIAAVNGRPIAKDYFENIKKRMEILKENEIRVRDEKEEKVTKAENTDEAVSYGMLDLFRTPNLRRKTSIITFIWFANTSVYVGLSYYAPALGGNPYFTFFLGAVVEIPTYLFLWPSMEYWGRRWTLCFSMVLGGTACIATVLSQTEPSITLVLYCIGKFGISSSFVVLPLMASELYPTVVRGLGLAISGVAGMIGPIIIPLINYLGTDMMVLPLIIMGGILILAGILSVFLPETLNKKLPQTLEEGEEFGKDMTWPDYTNCCPKWNALKEDLYKVTAADLEADKDFIRKRLDLSHNPVQKNLLPNLKVENFKEDSEQALMNKSKTS